MNSKDDFLKISRITTWQLALWL